MRISRQRTRDHHIRLRGAFGLKNSMRSDCKCWTIPNKACKDDGLVPRSGLSLVAKDYIYERNPECRPKSADRFPESFSSTSTIAHLPMKKLGYSCQYLDPVWGLNIVDSNKDRISCCTFWIFCLNCLPHC
jgi:hypothetical protein